MRLDWWLTRPGFGTVEIDERIVFTPYTGKFKSVVFVESPEELELVEILQLMHGQEVNVHPFPGTDMNEIFQHYSRVFTTWDPTDRNRI